jgi:hypothetical protein
LTVERHLLLQQPRQAVGVVVAHHTRRAMSVDDMISSEPSGIVAYRRPPVRVGRRKLHCLAVGGPVFTYNSEWHVTKSGTTAPSIECNGIRGAALYRKELAPA